MTTTPTKAQLPLSEIPITFKDGKIEISTDLSVGILDDGTIGFHSEEVTLENLLGRVCTVDLYPEAIAAVHWTLKCVLASVSDNAKKAGKEISPEQVVDLTVIKYVVKFLEVCNEQFNQDMDKASDFVQCIYELGDHDIHGSLKICYQILVQLEEFLPALFNYLASGLIGEALEKETLTKMVVDSQTAAVIAICRGVLGDVI